MAAITSAVVIGASSMANSMAQQGAISDANKQAKKGVFQGGTTTNAGGGGSVEFDSDGKAIMSTNLGGFQDSFDNVMGQAGDFFGGNQSGANDKLGQLQNLGSNSIQDIRSSEGMLGDRFQNQSDFNSLGDSFSRDMALASQDPAELGRDIASQFQPALDRAQGNMRNGTFDSLFSSGKSGNSQAASPILEGLQQQFGEQQTGLQDFGRQQALQQQNQAFGRATAASGQREAIGSRQFGENFSTSQLLSQNAMQRFGIGNNMFSQFLGNQQQQQGLGMQSLSAGQSISQQPLAFMNALQGAGALRSDSILGGAGIMSSNAMNASNPFATGLQSGISAFGGMG